MCQTAYAADVLYIVVLGLSKGSTILFYQRVFPKPYRRMVYALVSATATWTIVSVLLLAVRCNHRYPWLDITSPCAALVRGFPEASRPYPIPGLMMPLHS